MAVTPTPTTRPLPLAKFRVGWHHAGVWLHHWAPALIAAAVIIAAVVVFAKHRGDRRRRRVGELLEACKPLGSKLVPVKTVWKHGDVEAMVVEYEPGAHYHDDRVWELLERRLSLLMTGREGQIVIRRLTMGRRFEAVRLVPAEVVEDVPAPQLPTIVPHPCGKPNPHSIPVGVSVNGEVCWQPGDAAHALAIGKTRRGKTVALKVIAAGCARAGWQVHIWDHKEIDFTVFGGWPNVTLVTDKEQIAIAARRLVDEINARFARMRATGADEPPLLVVADELATLFTWYRQRHSGRLEPQPILDIEDIAGRGAGANVHLALGIQRPEAAVLGGTLRYNTDFRVAFGRLNPEERKMVGIAAGTEVTNKCKGRGIVSDPEVDDLEMQAYWVDRDILERLRPPSEPPFEPPSDVARPALRIVENSLSEGSGSALPSVRAENAPWLTTAEVAMRLGISQPRVSQLAARGVLHARPHPAGGRAKLYDPAEVDAVVRERTPSHDGA